MRKILAKMAAGVAAVLMMLATTAMPAMATSGAAGPIAAGSNVATTFGVDTAILKDCGNDAEGSQGEGIFCILNIVLNVLTTGVGVLGTLGIVISGVQYMTARDSAEQLTKAKNRLINIVIGLAVYAVMWGFLQWIIPGGILNGSSS